MEMNKAVPSFKKFIQSIEPCVEGYHTKKEMQAPWDSAVGFTERLQGKGKWKMASSAWVVTRGESAGWGS